MVIELTQGKVNWKILSHFLRTPYKEFSFSGLVRLTHSGPTNVKKSIDLLSQKKIIIMKEGKNYKINLRSQFTRSLFIAYSWGRMNDLPQNVLKCIERLVDEITKRNNIISIYIFGSALYSKKPNDFDLAVVYENNEFGLEKIWIEAIGDYKENIELHLFNRKEYLEGYKKGDYRVTSTLAGALVLFDKNFIFNLIHEMPIIDNNLLKQRIKETENKISESFSYFSNDREKSKTLLKGYYDEFLRIYIIHKNEIPLSRHNLENQAKKAGLDIKKRDLWETLEWIDKMIKNIKRNI